MTVWLFDLDKRERAIHDFSLDKATTPGGAVDRKEYDRVSCFVREFFDSPFSKKLMARQVGTAAGIVNDTPARPMSPRES